MGRIVTASLILISAAVAESRERQEIKARHWFHNPVYRLHDDRDVLLFFFSTTQRESARWARRLELIRRRPDVVVIGLTRDSKEQVERFLRRYRIRFTVGANSPSAKDFRVRRLPAVRLLKRAGGELEGRTIDYGALGELLQDWPETASTPEESEAREWRLKAFIASDADGRTRAKTAGQLFDLIGPEAFLEFAEGLLPYERDPWARGRIEFLCEVARGSRSMDEDFRGPSGHYMKAYRDDPEAPAWREVRAYAQRLEGASVEAILSEYYDHFSDRPADVLVRRFAVHDLWKCSDRDGARKALLDLLPSEPDASIRLVATMALHDVCETGDTEAAALLDELARTERYIRHVRPMMEWVAHVIRTGQWEVETMPLPGKSQQP